MSSPLCAECKSPSPGFLEEGTGRFFCGSSCQYAFIEGGQKRPREEEEEDIDNLLEAWGYLKKFSKEDEARTALVKNLDALLKNTQDEETFKKIIESGYESETIDLFLLVLRKGNASLILWFIERADFVFDQNYFGDYIDEILQLDNYNVIKKIFSMDMFLYPKEKDDARYFYNFVGSIETLKLYLDHGLPKGCILGFSEDSTTGMSILVERGREDLALFLLDQGGTPFVCGESPSKLLRDAAYQGMGELAVRLIRNYGMNPFQQPPEGGETALDFADSVRLQLAMLVEFYTQEFLKNNFAPQRNVSFLLAARTLQSQICHQINSSTQEKLFELAKAMNIPEEIRDEWLDSVPSVEELCERISEILALGTAWDAERYAEMREKRRGEFRSAISLFERFTDALDYLKVRWRGRNFEDVLEELRRKTQ